MSGLPMRGCPWGATNKNTDRTTCDHRSPKEDTMRDRWVRDASVALSLVQVIVSYRYARLTRRGRLVRLLLLHIPAHAFLAVRARQPSSRRRLWWHVGEQLLGLTLTILGQRYPARRRLLSLVSGVVGVGLVVWESLGENDDA